MIAIQKPPPHMFAAPLCRPSHSRAPSAPVVVRPTHTPGLLSLSKPSQPAPRPQTAQQQRQHRSSPRAKPQQQSPQPAQALAQASEAAKKPAGSVPKADTATPEKASEKPSVQTTTAVSPDKPPRGRQGKQASKDKAQRRSASSSSCVPARRQSHQPSPPPSTRIPSQAEVSSKRSPRSSRQTVSAPDLTDPFVDNAPAVRDLAAPAPVKAGPKGPTFRSPPPLAQPSGKLARRRQLNSRASTTPTQPKSAPRRKERVAALVGTVNDSTMSSLKTRHVTTGDWDSFPICDDSADHADDSDDTPPTTPLRETASVPPKRASRVWHPADGFDVAPHTAPLSSTHGFPFVPPNPSSTPTPAQRRRNHRRAPSEGVFHMSMDEDSSSSTSDLFSFTGMPAAGSRRMLAAEFMQARAHPVDGGHASSAPQAGYFAGSIFQSSPSPEELPPPSF